ISLPAAALDLVPKLAPLELTGEMNLQVPSLSIGRSATRGSATLQWRAAGSALSPVSPLGDYELRLEGEGPAVRATLHTLQGPLQLDGQGSWPNGRKPVFLATAQMPPEYQQRLAPFLRLITVERGDGSFEWQLK
ncbi:MAG TPA: type II secretion system protein N, partial [Luteimonas sp.]|nr:type II secretion system protein N [Luteimonas sp.]